MSGIKHLTIVPYTDSAFSQKAGDSFTATINPTDYSRNLSVQYTDSCKPVNLPNVSKTYKGTAAEQVSFKLLFDGTGVIKNSGDVSTQLQLLYKACYTINSTTHRPNFVKLFWGVTDMQFSGYLTSCEVSYSMFKPDGTILRAEASVSFEEYIDPLLLKQQLNLNSPDMTHMIEIREGDTLPLLCNKIYGDSSYYLQVASANKLVSFRQLQPGTHIYFPPIKK
ncbi:MAG: hypothetical protein QM731_19220 [Chitinophagaceae bacterium]